MFNDLVPASNDAAANVIVMLKAAEAIGNLSGGDKGKMVKRIGEQRVVESSGQFVIDVLQLTKNPSSSLPLVPLRRIRILQR